MKVCSEIITMKFHALHFPFNPSSPGGNPICKNRRASCPFVRSTPWGNVKSSSLIGIFFSNVFGIGFLLVFHKPFFDIKFLYFYYSRFYKKSDRFPSDNSLPFPWLTQRLTTLTILAIKYTATQVKSFIEPRKGG